ncbi:MAG: hypothetical protein N2422_10780 [Rhodobacteraceae bacterium]|nr:hypothetical protein [Paracoccaceae bacterium]
MDPAAERLLAALARVLGRQREALAAARFADLPALALEAAALGERLAALPRGALDAAVLRRTAGLAARVLDDIGCARAGLRDAIATVEAIRRAAGTLATYDRLGRAAALATAAGGVERRA